MLVVRIVLKTNAKYIFSYQHNSVLGRAPWLRPFELDDLGGDGVGRDGGGGDDAGAHGGGAGVAAGQRTGREH